MSNFPRSPRLLKGAFIAIRPDSRGKISSQNSKYLVFQYNPETLTRRLTLPESRDKSETNIFTSITRFFTRSIKPIFPKETISLTLELDATDYLEMPEKYPHIVEHGLHTYLATLESMMSPESIKNEVKSTELPLVLFHWGKNRILPVRLINYTVVEEAFDPNLNPIRVKIQICMRVLDISDFEKDSVGYNISMQNIKKKEILALLK